ncbi:MAG: hypothetical protein AAF551_07690 [Bacteroidota bacterium]
MSDSKCFQDHILGSVHFGCETKAWPTFDGDSSAFALDRENDLFRGKK